MRRTIVMAVAAFAVPSGEALAGSAQDAAIAEYRQQATKDFSAERGRAFFLARHKGGKPDTPSCTTCHTTDPLKSGKTRAGKEIAPMALSKTPDRFSDTKKLEKWFRRNCDSVLGRACTADEKGDFLTYMVSQ